MTARLQPLSRTIVGALLAVLALGLWGTSPATAADTGEDTAAIDNALPDKGTVRLLVSVPGDSEVDLSGVEVTMGGEAAEAEAVAASQSSCEAHLHPRDRHQRQHARHPDRRGQEGCPRIPLGRARQRGGRRPDLRRRGQPGGAAEPRPRTPPRARSPTCSSRSRPRCTTESSVPSMPPDRAAPRPASARSWCSPTARTPPPRRWTTWWRRSRAPRPRSTSSPCRAGTRRTRH